jgi:predicted dehydrogenase
MSNNDPVRVGVVGASPPGFGDRAHLPAVKASAGLTLEAVCTTREETARSAARKWGARKWYAGIDGLVNDPQIDVVTVAVRPRMHYPLTMAALRAGKPVFCEWPLALDTAEALEMRAVAEENAVPTAVGLQGRFAPAVLWAKKLVADGAVGKPLSFLASQMLSKFEVDSDRAWLVHHEEASGALFVAFGHVMDSIRFILGDVDNISGRQMTLSPAGVYTEGGTFQWKTADTVMTIAELTGGIVGTSYVSNATSPAQGYSLRIIGEEGQILLGAPSYYQFSPVRLSRGPLQVSVGREGSDSLEEMEIPSEYFSDMPVTEGHSAYNVARALTDFGDSIREKRRFRPDFTDGVYLHRLLDAVMTSSREGRRITI